MKIYLDEMLELLKKFKNSKVVLKDNNFFH